jgi:hypothetical protein
VLGQQAGQVNLTILLDHVDQTLISEHLQHAASKQPAPSNMRCVMQVAVASGLLSMFTSLVCCGG